MLVERLPQLLRTLDPELALRVAEALARHGVVLLLGGRAGVGLADGLVRSVLLNHGRAVPSDLVAPAAQPDGTHVVDARTAKERAADTEPPPGSWRLGRVSPSDPGGGSVPRTAALRSLIVVSAWSRASWRSA